MRAYARASSRCVGRPRVLNAVAHRSLWSAAASLRTSSSAAHFLSAARTQSRADPSWAVDFPLLESLAVTAADRASVEGLGPLLAAVAREQERGGAAPIAELTLTLSSQASYATAVGLVRHVGRGLRTLRIHADVDAAPMGGSGGNDAAHPSSLSDGVASLLRAVLAVKQRGQCDLSAVPLEELELVIIDGNLRSTTCVDDALLNALTALITSAAHGEAARGEGSGASTPALHTLTLRHVNCQQCGERAVAVLAGAVSQAAGLRTLDLRGSGHLVQHLLRDGRLRKLTRLRSLDLGGCPLGDVGARTLLEELAHGMGGWYALDTLRLPQCGWTAYGAEQMLAQVRAMPSAQGVEVRRLVLSGNPLTDAAATPLATCLVRCHRLEELDLRHGELTERSAGFLVSSLAHAPGLRVLCLRSNRMGAELAGELARYSHHWPALQVLDITRCRVSGSRAVRAVARALAHLESLQELHLSGNNLRVDGAGDVDEDSAESAAEVGLFAHAPGYVKGGEGGGRVPTSFELDRRDREGGRVRYRGPPLDPAAAPAQGAFEALAEALAGCRALRLLDLSDCCLSDANVTALATGAAPGRLEELRLGANPALAQPAAVTALVQLLWGCAPHLRVLDLALTALGDWGLLTLCDGPVDEVEDAGASPPERMRGVLPEMAALEVLQLSHARVGPLGLEALTEAVAGLPALRALMLDGCTASDGNGDDGAERCVALLGALGRHGPRPVLRVVSLAAGGLAGPARQRVMGSGEASRLTAAGVQVLV